MPLFRRALLCLLCAHVNSSVHFTLRVNMNTRFLSLLSFSLFFFRIVSLVFFISFFVVWLFAECDV